MSASQRMFGSLWNVVVAREHRRQDGSRRLGTMAKCQTATGVGLYEHRNATLKSMRWGYQ